MKIEFKKFSEFERGILYRQLLDAYSFNENCKKTWEKDWLEYDNFFYDNLKYTKHRSILILLNVEPIGHICCDTRNFTDYVIICNNCILTHS